MVYKELIDKLVREDILRTEEIINAFYKIKRRDFLKQEFKDQAALDTALPIDCGQTISQPYTVAFMLELLQPRQGDIILDVGSGSGWTTALLAEIVGKRGKVYGIERIKELKKFGEENILKYNFIDKKIVEIFLGDGAKGLPNKKPFDKILVSAASPEIPPPLLEQLKINGRMIIPVESGQGQDIILIKKTAKDKFEKEKYPGFVFVPLVS